MSSNRVPCPQCGHMNTPERRWCKKCKVEIAKYEQEVERPDSPVSDAKRRDTLETQVQKFVKNGYKIVHRSDYSAQLSKPKEIDFLIAFLLFLFFIVPFIVYPALDRVAVG